MARKEDLSIDDLLHGLAEAEAKHTQASVDAPVCFDGVVAFVFDFGRRKKGHLSFYVYTLQVTTTMILSVERY